MLQLPRSGDRAENRSWCSVLFSITHSRISGQRERLYYCRYAPPTLAVLVVVDSSYESDSLALIGVTPPTEPSLNAVDPRARSTKSARRARWIALANSSTLLITILPTNHRVFGKPDPSHFRRRDPRVSYRSKPASRAIRFARPGLRFRFP